MRAFDQSSTMCSAVHVLQLAGYVSPAGRTFVVVDPVPSSGPRSWGPSTSRPRTPLPSTIDPELSAMRP